MRSNWARQTGFTIVETATMLMVLFILAGALAPVVSESISTARAIKAVNDAQVIASGMIQFERDMGPAAFSMATAYTVSAKGVRRMLPGLPVQELVSTGEAPQTQGEDQSGSDDGTAARFGLTAPGAVAPRSSYAQRQAWLDAAVGFIEDHLITNNAGHRPRRPNDESGWNGPYISSGIKSDPWGNRYMINAAGMGQGASAVDMGGRSRSAVFVVSAGANGVIETPFDQPVTDAHLYGDDIGVRIR